MDRFPGLPPLLDAVRDLLSRDRWQLTDTELADAHHRTRVLMRALHAYESHLLADVDARSIPEQSQARNTVQWLGSRENLDAATARREVELARAVAAGHVPTVAAGWAEGRLDAARGYVIADTVTALLAGVDEWHPERGVDPADIVTAEKLLGTHAKILRPCEVAKAAKRVRAHLLPEQRERADDPATRSMGLRQTLGGIGTFEGELDAAGYEIVATALNAFMAGKKEKSGNGHVETAAQRRGQALVGLCSWALSRSGATHPGAAPSGAAQSDVSQSDAPQSGVPQTNGFPTTVAVTIDFEALRSGVGAADVHWGQPLTAATARQLCCDAKIVPVVLGSKSEPLDIGRATRTVPPAMRRAVIIRDGGCVHPGCDRPPAYTEAHHIIHWANGGATALGNLVLLCATHHTAIHRYGWRVGLDTDGTPFHTPPAWLDPDQTPRYHARHIIRRQ